jgi:hypothetical protein
MITIFIPIPLLPAYCLVLPAPCSLFPAPCFLRMQSSMVRALGSAMLYQTSLPRRSAFTSPARRIWFKGKLQARHDYVNRGFVLPLQDLRQLQPAGMSEYLEGTRHPLKKLHGQL